MAKNEVLDFSGPTCLSSGYFIHILYVISMIKMVILYQSKPISLYLKIKKLKFKIQKFVNCTFIIHKTGNKTSIQPILNSNSTSFMFNNIFCEMNIKVIHWGGGAKVNGGTILISSWKYNYSIYLDIQVYYLDIQAISTLLCLLFFLMCNY